MKTVHRVWVYTFLLVLALASAPVFAASFPIASGVVGAKIIVDGNEDVVVTFQGYRIDTRFSNDLYYESETGSVFLFNNKSSTVGAQVNLGKFPIGTELVFRLRVTDTGTDFFTGPASRNPDNRAHARVQSDWRPGESLVSFEDHTDFLYNDLSFSFTNTRASGSGGATVLEIPTLSDWGLFAFASLLALFGAVRLKRNS